MAIPKPLLPVGDTPIIEVVIRQLAAAGIDRVVLALGHMAPLFTAFVGDGSRWGLKIESFREEEPLGTAGGLRLVKELSQDFIVMNGDILTTLDYRALIATHRQHDAWATIALTQREIPIEFGVVEATENGLLREYREKPTIRYEVSMGINVLSSRCIDFIRPGRKFDMPDLLLAIHRAGKPIVCHRTNCYWQDIGLFEDYERASADFTNDRSRFLPDLQVKQCALV